MDIKTVCNTLAPLRNIGSEILDTNAPYQFLLAERLIAAGKPIEQMTIDEVTHVINDANADYQEQCDEY